MPTISLTDLVDVVSLSGTPKSTKVAQIKARPDYEPQFDFYKPLREAIQDLHRKGAGKDSLDKVLMKATSPAKYKHYKAAIDGYKKLLGKKAITWFEPPRTLFNASGVEVIVNPELGLEFGGQRYVVKLYLKDEAVSKLRMDLITCLMEDALRPKVLKTDVMAVVDVRAGKLFKASAASKKLVPMIGAELAYIAHLWPLI